MSNIYGANNRIGCEPILRKSIEANVSKGFATVKQKTELIPLKVIYGGPSSFGYVSAGDTVYVKGEMTKAHWALEEYDVEGQTVILVPLEQVQLIKSGARGE